MATLFHALLESLGIHYSSEDHIATVATHPFEALFERLGIHKTPESPSKEEMLALFLSMFVLFNLVFRFIDKLQYLNVATIHLVAYALCSFTDCPLKVTADVLISTFFFITVFKLIFFVLGRIYMGELAKWIFIMAAACSFVAGPEQPGSEGASDWVHVWNYGMGMVHKYLVTIGIGPTGIFVGFLKEGGYESPLFCKSALLFATIRGGIQAYYRQLAAGPGGPGGA
ncbi:hypothetical protein DL98DRAFT_579829 [Cadophora sp. DSE1049]|nr:hypothetical protein DL98DRAFT_579829 [Cadophora sp. DSE1049]